jgi:lipoyl(octanoyl) transferase
MTMIDDQQDIQLHTLQAMRSQEEQSYHMPDYLSRLPATSSCRHPPVDAAARQQIAQWCINIMEACSYQREYAAVTMSFLDRFVSTTEGHSTLLDRTQYQLAALTAIYTSVKIHCPQALSPDLVAKLSQGSFTRQDIEAMERRMLSALQWRVNPPTPMHFIRAYLDLIPTSGLDEHTRKVILDLAALQAEKSVLDYRFVPFKASHIAFGSLLNAVESVVGECNMDYLNDVTKVIYLSSGIDPAALSELQCYLYEAMVGQDVEIPCRQSGATHPPKKMRRESLVESPRSIVDHCHQ